MTTQAARRARPGGVTLVIVLMWINAVLEILVGVLTMIASGDLELRLETGQSQSVLLWVGIVGVVLGLITVALAMGLARGSNGARAIVTILVVLQILADVWELATRAHPSVPWFNVLAILFWLLILAFLWTSRASAFFRRS